ncbi:30S ribosomal protein S27ae [Candidatus Parvarchaeota archaeon]|nr:30S ribosomal protein S27ae [Candidatus Parvarchaeota archaeon]
MEKKKQKESEIWKMYKIEGDSITRVNRTCPKCGEGTFLAEHENRYTCGRCGYTEFKRKDKN